MPRPTPRQQHQPPQQQQQQRPTFRPTVPMVRGEDGRLHRASTTAEEIGPRTSVNGPSSSSSATGPEYVRVGAVVNYGNGQMRTIRFRWPVDISEAQALAEVLKSLSAQEHAEVSGVVLNQVADRLRRIEWLEEPPLGHYYFNQELYGENGSHRRAPLNVNLAYSPDVPGVAYQGDPLAGYTQQQEVRGGGGYVDPRQFLQQQQQQQQPIPAFLLPPQQRQQQQAPAPTYNPDDVFQHPAPMYQTQRY